MQRIMACISAVSVLVLGPMALSDVMTGTQLIAPDTHVAISQTNSEGGVRWGGTSTDQRALGQTFDTNATLTLDKIALQVNVVGSDAVNADFTLEIFKVIDEFNPEDDGGFDGDSNLISIATQSGTLPASMDVADYLIFDLDDVTLPLLPDDSNPARGEHYGFLLRFDSAASTQYLNFERDSSNPYADGAVIRSDVNGGNLARTGDTDLKFYLIAVPEPGSLALLGLGGMMMLKRKRYGVFTR